LERNNWKVLKRNNLKLDRKMISKRELIKNSSTAILFILITAGSIIAGGLSTQLGEVVIENLQVGQQYNLRELANLRLPVTNKSDVDVYLKLDVIVPEESELRHNAIPVPNKTWIELSDSLFELEAGGTAESDILIRIPNDDQYLGQKFQVMIWSHTIPGENASMFLACGLKSRIIFTTDTVRAEINESAAIMSAAPSFQLDPVELTIENLPAGERYEFESNTGTQLKITNTSKVKHTFRVMSKTSNNSESLLPSGYLDAPNASYLSFSQDEFTLEPGQTQKVNAYLSFPADSEFNGNKYMFIVHVFSIGEQVRSGKYSRVFVTLE
jgi:hypothetical protein